MGSDDDSGDAMGDRFAPGSGSGTGVPPPADWQEGEAGWQEGEDYLPWIENEFIDPKEDPLCTFGVDVDTASYTLMRRDLEAGLLPVPESVRVEEYLNFFSYDTAPPEAEHTDAFAVQLEGAPSRFGENLHLLRIAIKGKEMPPVQRGRANLVFLVDISGSMASADKLPLVKETLRLLVDQLREDDTIGLVTYAGAVGVALVPTPVSQREKILAAIDKLDAGGSTYGEGGITEAYALAEKHLAEGGINRVVLCTDGDFNVGKTGDALVDLIVSYRDRGIYLTTLGFGGGNYNDSLMKSLASKGNGNYAYIDSQKEADRVVRRNLLGTLVVIAQDVKLQLKFHPETVSRYRLIGYENRIFPHDRFEDPREDTGEIGSGHHVTALLELELAAGADAGATVAEVNLRYKLPGETTDIPMHRAVSIADFAQPLDAASADFRFAAAVAEYAEILRRSKHSEGFRFDEVMSLAGPAAGEHPDRLEFLELVSRARGLWKDTRGGID